MKNRKIVFDNQKGGVGKSTLCILFANYLAFKKKDVCIIDTDLQKTIMMQRRKDSSIYDSQEEPYSVQEFDIDNPQSVQQLMNSASEVDGYVLFDSPGNVSQNGLIPMFVNADYIICPFEYEEKTLDSTGIFIQVINKLQETYPKMKTKIFFLPNKIDARIGTTEEMAMWKQTDEIFKKFGRITPAISARATLKRVNTYELLAIQRDAVMKAFDYIIKHL